MAHATGGGAQLRGARLPTVRGTPSGRSAATASLCFRRGFGTTAGRSVGCGRGAPPPRTQLPVTAALEDRPLLRPRDVRAALARHGLAARKALGQHFITDPNTIRKVVRDAGVEPGDVVVEVGPGLGSLTLALLGAGARVLAVEVDAGLARALEDVCGAPRDDLAIVVADAVRADWPALVAAHAPARPPAARPAVRMVANLPYNVSTHIVLGALRSEVFDALHVMVQREVGERWTAAPGSSAYGAVSVKVALRAEARIAAAVSRRAFAPVPNVDSVTVALHPRPWPHAAAGGDGPGDGAGVAGIDIDATSAVVDAGFAQRRKQLRNALRAAGWTAEEVGAALAAAGVRPQARGEELPPATWVALAAALPRRPGRS